MNELNPYQSEKRMHEAMEGQMNEQISEIKT